MEPNAELTPTPEAAVEAAIEPTEKSPEDMSERELLCALLARQEKSAKINWIAAGALVALAVVMLFAVLILVPLATRTLNQAYDTLVDTQDTVLQAQESLKQVTERSEQARQTLDSAYELTDQAKASLEEIDEMVKNVDKLVDENTSMLEETIRKLGEVDFETLNQSIEDLSAVVGPLAHLFARN